MTRVAILLRRRLLELWWMMESVDKAIGECKLYYFLNCMSKRVAQLKTSIQFSQLPLAEYGDILDEIIALENDVTQLKTLTVKRKGLYEKIMLCRGGCE
jgi:hypothetical protein